MNNGGVLRGNKVISWVPDQPVLKLRIGDSKLTEAAFERLAAPFFADLARKFLP